MKPTQKQYENLANAIILQAVDDWRACTVEKNGMLCHPRSDLVNRTEIEAFFRSKWFTELSSIDPERLITTLKDSEKST